MKFYKKFLVELSDSIIWNIIQDFGNDRLSIDDCCDKIVDYVLEVAKNSDYEVEKNSEELEVYKEALDWMADRCEVLDKIANPTYESICFKAKRWKEIALQKARGEE